MHIWDFGGQHFYHGTHRFFLTKRSLYVVLADNRKQDTDFDYWLQMAELYGEGSPLYVVVNQSDNRPPYPNIGGMKARFDFLKDMLAANLEFMPRGIFARFAVEVHRLIAYGQQFIWREGAVLQPGDSYALVTETYGNREIVVRCTKIFT